MSATPVAAATGALTPRRPTVVTANPVQRFVSGPQLPASVTVAAVPTVTTTPRVFGAPQAYGSVTMSTVAGNLTPRQGFSVGSVAAPCVMMPAASTQALICAPPPVPYPVQVTAPRPPVSGNLTPPPPTLTTEGLPNPQQIDTQRSQYMKTLDDQLKEGAEVLNQQLKQQQDYLMRMGDQQKRQFGLQVDQDIKHKELELVQQHNHQLLMLQQAAQQQKVALEQQANALLIEYNQKKASEDLSAQMFTFEHAAADAHRKYQEEIQALQQAQAVGAQQLAQQGHALAHQANMSNMQAIQAQQVASRTSASLTAPMPTPASYLSPVGIPTPPASYLPPVQPGMMAAVPTTYSFPRSSSRSVMGTGFSTPVPTAVAVSSYPGR